MITPREKSSKKGHEIKSDLIKDKVYVTKKIYTSISILDSPENDVVLDSLLFLSKYADIQLRNVTYLQQLGITTKLINLLDRNICILRLVLRLLALLLKKTPSLSGLDNETYDDKILEISKLYINHKDKYVREFCLDILSSVAKSYRITCLIFKADLFKPILETIRHPPSTNLLISALNFLKHLLESPLSLEILQAIPSFDVRALLITISNEDVTAALEAYDIINKLTSEDITAFQSAFKENHLVEKMMEVVVNTNQKCFHQKALEVIKNCLNSEETGTYFVKSINFLSFCQWAKHCDDVYLSSCANFFEKLTGIPSMIQTLYDLSVEETVISLLRSKEKEVLKQVCKSISNLAEHKYCCEDMLKPTIIESLVKILDGKNGSLDSTNEAALKTIYCFFARSVKTLPFLCEQNIVPILLRYLSEPNNITKESKSKVIHMLYKIALISSENEQKCVVGDIFFEELLRSAISDTAELAALSLEILVHFVGQKIVNNIFLHGDGPRLLLDRLKVTLDTKLLKFILLFIHRSMLSDQLSIEFVKYDVLGCLETLPPGFLDRAPIVNTVKTLAFKRHLPTKFFKTGKLDVTDKLGNKFYIVKGPLVGPFPFLDNTESQKDCTNSTLYIVDYTYEIEANAEELTTTEATHPSISFERIASDPFLPCYVMNMANNVKKEWNLERKIQFLAKYVDEILGRSSNNDTPEKYHDFRIHLENLKSKLLSNIIPIGFLRLGSLCERALLFKAIADKINILCTLEHRNYIYWNEVAVLANAEGETIIKFYIVDLLHNIGALLPVGSNNACKYMCQHLM